MEHTTKRKLARWMPKLMLASSDSRSSSPFSLPEESLSMRTNWIPTKEHMMPAPESQKGKA